jgi:hypothetical protein
MELEHKEGGAAIVDKQKCLGLAFCPAGIIHGQS